MTEFDEAVARGEALATAELSKIKIDNTVAYVSVNNSYHNTDNEYYALCLICNWPRNSDLCHCTETPNA